MRFWLTLDWLIVFSGKFFQRIFFPQTFPTSFYVGKIWKPYESEDAGKIRKRYHGESLLKLINRPIQWFNKTVFYATLDSNFSLDQAIISFLQRNETVGL